jgi:serine/threonine-protein kinase
MGGFSSRCNHCGEWHETGVRVCPTTRLEISVEASTDEVPIVPLTPKDPRLGQTVAGRYFVRKLLGQGSLGPVYAGEHIDFQRPVAVRFLEPEHASRDVATRLFHGEARAAWALSHPNLCEVLDMGQEDDGTPFVITEYLRGESLRHAMKRLGPLPTSGAIDIAMQVLSALTLMHDRQIPHRDLRPENIWLAERQGCPPHVLLLDAGLGKLVSPSKLGARWSTEGVVAEMPFYLPPERARGEQGTDERGDLFAVGVVFFEMLTGQKPFYAVTFQELMIALSDGVFTRASLLRADLSDPFDAVFDKALAVHRDDRYESALMFQEDLRGLLELSRYQKMARGEEFSQVLVAEAPVSAAGTDEGFTMTGTETATRAPLPILPRPGATEPGPVPTPRGLPAPPPRKKPAPPQPRNRKASNLGVPMEPRPLPPEPASEPPPASLEDPTRALFSPFATPAVRDREPEDEPSLVTSQTATLSAEQAQAALSMFEDDTPEESTSPANLPPDLVHRVRAMKAELAAQVPIETYEEDEQTTLSAPVRSRPSSRPKPKRK